MTIETIKQAREDKQSQLFKDCSLFFAFNNNQFDKAKTPLQEGEKYVTIGGGGYLPKGKADQFEKGIYEIELWFKNEIEVNQLRKEHILYELNNHEAFYTGEIEPTLEALGDGYTKEEVQEVYNTGRLQEVN